MKRIAISSLLLAGLAILCQSGPMGQASDQADEAKAVKIYCPLVGLPGLKTECGCPGGYCSLKPKEGITADYQGGKVRFCCGECMKTFKKTPAKFAATANHQLVATKQAKQIKCPLCGSELRFVSGVSVAGIHVGFCSGNCSRKVADASAAEQIDMVFGEKAFARGFTVTVEPKK